MRKINPKNFNHNLRCPSCNGKKSLSYYPVREPHVSCHKCKFTTFDPIKLKEILNIDIDNNNNGVNKNLMTKSYTAKFPIEGTIKALKERGLDKEDCEYFGVETIVKINSKTKELETVGTSFPYHNDEQEYVAQKIKSPNKDMTIRGNWSDINLFGQHLFPAGCNKFITITEGEEDTIAAHKMMRTDPKYLFPVVSVPNGAKSAKGFCQKKWEYLNSFETIVICFDNDEEGKAASIEVAELFPNKAKIMRMDKYKDANEYLLAGKKEEFRKLWWAAEKVTPMGVILSSKLLSDMLEENSAITVPYPWNGLQDKLYGMRTGELVVWKAPPKIGKTQIFRELAYHIKTTTEFNVGLIFLEETTKRIGMGLCSLHMKKNLQVPDAVFSVDELTKAYNELLADDRFLIFDPKAERTAENVFNKIMHFVKAYECKYVFLDHVSMLAYDNMENDERRFLDKLFKDLKDATVSLDIHISAITHVNDEGKSRGSRASYQLCDALISLERDKLNPDEFIANTMALIVEENRISGECGLACHLNFDRETSRFTEVDLDFIVEEKEKTLKKANLKFEE